MHEYIYEICDITNEESYSTMGVFDSLDNLDSSIRQADIDGERLTDDQGDYDGESIGVYMRVVGRWTSYGDKGVLVREIYRACNYSEEEDECTWLTTSDVTTPAWNQPNKHTNKG